METPSTARLFTEELSTLKMLIDLFLTQISHSRVTALQFQTRHS